MKIKTIDINAKEWFDKTYGNSYFSANICINYGMKTEINIPLKFQYGYGSHYINKAFEELISLKIIKPNKDKSYFSYWEYCKEKNIILRYSKKENCLKRELIH